MSNKAKPLPGLIPYRIGLGLLYLRKPTRRDVQQWHAWRAANPGNDPVTGMRAFAWAVDRYVVEPDGGRMFAGIDDVLRTLNEATLRQLGERIMRM